MILLDTDHITMLQWGGIAGQRIRDRLRILGLADAPPTTIITYEEQIRGWMAGIAKTRTIADLVRVYDKLAAHLRYFSTLQVIPFTEKAATEYQRLRALKLPIGTMDLRIAAIALAHDATLFSRNLSDFRKVPALQVQDASA